MLDNAELQPTPPVQSPSLQPDGPPAGQSVPSPAPEPEEQSDGRSWWARLWNTRGHQSDRSDDVSEEPERNGHEPIEPKPRIVTLTEEELGERIRREAQSQRDRENYRQRREAEEAERRRLREEDPWQFAQQDREREQNALMRQQQVQQLAELLGHTTRQHDAVSIDTVLFALPKQEQERILGMPNAGQGLEGRKLIVEESLKTYGRQEYERGVRETQAKLKKDPAFRKSVLAEMRGMQPEPELYSGDSPREGSEDSVSSRLRDAYFNRR